MILLGYFAYYLFLSRELVINTIIAIKEYDNVFYAEPFEQLSQTIQSLMTNGQNYFLLFSLLGTFSTILLQWILFYFRKKEYRTYLLLNERKSTLSHQITTEQLILINAALLTLFILFLILQSILTDFFSNLETAMIIQQEPGWKEINIQSLSEASSILDQTGFTRFHIKPFLIGTAKTNILKPFTWQYIPLVFVVVNIINYVVIYLTNYVFLRIKKI